MTQPLRRSSAAAAALFLAVGGCVTVPPAGYPPQSLAVSTHHQPGPGLGWGSAPIGPPEELPGVQCTASNDRGSWTLVTPGVLAVERSKARLRITCRREGYREAVVELPCVMSGTEAAAVFELVPLMGPFLLVLLPAAIIGRISAAARDDVCAYGGGHALRIGMQGGM